MKRLPPRALFLVAPIVTLAATPALGSIGTVTDLTSKIPATSKTWALAAAPDGSMWVGETSVTPGSQAVAARSRTRVRRSHGSFEPYLRVVRLSPDGAVRFFNAGQPDYSSPGGMAWSGGALWMGVTRFGNTGVAVRMRSDGTVDRTVTLPGAGAAAMESDPAGALWALVLSGGPPGAVRIDPADGAVSAVGGSPVGRGDVRSATVARGLLTYATSDQSALTTISRAGAIGSIPVGTGANPLGVAGGEDGSLWWTPNFAGSGTVVRQSAAGAAGEPLPLPNGTTGYQVVVDPGGNAWVLTNTAQLVRMTPAGSSTVTLLPEATGSTDSAVIGADGNVWIAHYPRGLYRVLTGTVPTNSSAPVVSGRLASGTTLSATAGAWNFLPNSYAYTWQRCSGTNANACTDIPGASGTTYAVNATDIERGGVRVLVSASNLNGSSQGAASNIATTDSPASGAFTLGKTTRKGYVITTRVTTPGPGSISQIGTIPGKKKAKKGARRATAKPKPVRVCSPKAVSARAAGTYTITCTLSKSARTMLAKKPLVVTLATAFAPSGGSRNAQNRRVRVPIITAERR